MLGSVSKAVDQDLFAEKVIRTNPRDRPASTATGADGAVSARASGKVLP